MFWFFFNCLIIKQNNYKFTYFQHLKYKKKLFSIKFQTKLKAIIEFSRRKKMIQFIENIWCALSLLDLKLGYNGLTFEFYDSNRFLTICHHLKCQMTKKCARYVIFFIWLYSSVIAIPWALYFTLTPIDSSMPDMVLCNEKWPNEYSEKTYFIIANLFLCYLIPLFIITSCYIAVWMKVWRRNIPGEQPKRLQMEYLLQRSKLKTTKMFVVVVSNHLIFYNLINN